MFPKCHRGQTVGCTDPSVQSDTLQPTAIRIPRHNPYLILLQDQRNAELKEVVDKASRRGGIVDLSALLVEAEARAEALEAHNAQIQHEYNLEHAESEQRLKLAAQATSERKAKEAALKELEHSRQANVLVHRELFEAKEQASEQTNNNNNIIII